MANGCKKLKLKVLYKELRPILNGNTHGVLYFLYYETEDKRVILVSRKTGERGVVVFERKNKSYKAAIDIAQVFGMRSVGDHKVLMDDEDPKFFTWHNEIYK